MLWVPTPSCAPPFWGLAPRCCSTQAAPSSRVRAPTTMWSISAMGSSTDRKLGLAEHHLALRIRDLATALPVGEHLDPTPDRGAVGDRIVPAPHGRVLRKVDVAALRIADPGEGADVGDRIIRPRQVFAF